MDSRGTARRRSRSYERSPAQTPGWQTGDALIRLDSPRPRCPMTTVDPETLAQDPEVLRDIGRRFGGRLALNAEVVRPGSVRVGDPVAFVAHREHGRSPALDEA